LFSLFIYIILKRL
jgi:hypothetical protein